MMKNRHSHFGTAPDAFTGNGVIFTIVFEKEGAAT